MKKIQSNQGFSMIEILVALTLIGLITALTIGNPFNSTRELDEEINRIESAINFMSDEAVLRNSVIRLNVKLDTTPQEYAVEYGPSDDFVLAPSEEKSSSLSKSEEEQLEKSQKSLDMKFNKVQEFQESNHKINENVRFIGMGTAYNKALKTDGSVALYTFASGEKDQALLFIGNESVIYSLEVEPFTKKIIKTSHLLDNSQNPDIIESQNEKAAEIFATWLSSQK